MAGTLARQAGRASASPRNEASRAPRIPGKYPPPPFAASWAVTLSSSRIFNHFVHETPADAAVADADLGNAGGGGDAVQDQRARQDDVGAAWVEANHPFAVGLGGGGEPLDLACENRARQAAAVDASRVVALE